MTFSAFFAGVDWPAFLLAMAVIELTPGPNMGWLAALSVGAGRRAGGMAVLGITIGLAIQVVAAATGVAAVVGQVEWMYDVLRWAGVGFMVYLAWSAWAETGTEVAGLASDGRSFRRGLISNVLNPKALVFYVVVIGQFTHPEAGALWLQVLVLGGIHVVIAFLVHSGIVLAGARIGGRIERWRTSVPVRAAFALSLLGIAVWIAWATRSGGA